MVGGSNRTVLNDLETFHEYGSDIIVATPGRLDDVLSRYENINVKSSFECLILDEGDVLLDMGFEQTVSSILRKLPKMRRTGLFSATQTKAVKALGRAGLRNPVMVSVAVASAVNKEDNTASNNKSPSSANVIQPTEQATPTSLTNYYMVCPLEEKLSRLVAFLNQHQKEKAVVFCLSCAVVEFIGCVLQQIPEIKHRYLEALHGKMVQKKREKVLERFRECKSGGALFCTDVAARGLDVADVDWVVQLDAPPDPSSFVHRVGRCARAGRSGKSLIVLTPAENAYVDFLRMRKIPVDILPDTEECLPSKESHIKKSASQKDGSIEENRLISSVFGGTLPDVLPSVKALVLQDRDALEKGTKAFTSYIRAYKEHQCSFIFR